MLVVNFTWVGVGGSTRMHRRIPARTSLSAASRCWTTPPTCTSLVMPCVGGRRKFVMDLDPAQIDQLSKNLMEATDKLRDAIGRCAVELSKRNLHGSHSTERFGVRLWCCLYPNGQVRVNKKSLSEMSREELCLFVDELPAILRMSAYNLDKNVTRTTASLASVERIIKVFSQTVPEGEIDHL